MSEGIIITCAVTGAGDTVGRHPGVPVTPGQIAEACIEAAGAGAAIVHIHVRDPETGKASRDPALFREVVELVRARDDKLIINLTAGMGGDFVPGADNPAVGGPGTDLLGPLERLAHVEDLLPDICSLDCGSMNYGPGDEIYINTTNYLRTMAQRCQILGVKPELEVFDLGHVRLATHLIEQGLVAAPPLFQICLGLDWGAGASPEAMLVLRDQLPGGAVWFAFGVGRMEMKMAAQSVLLGGNIRVGLEDNLYLRRGTLASNGQLVEKAARIAEDLGVGLAGPDEARRRLGLRKPEEVP